MKKPHFKKPHLRKAKAGKPSTRPPGEPLHQAKAHLSEVLEQMMKKKH